MAPDCGPAGAPGTPGAPDCGPAGAPGTPGMPDCGPAGAPGIPPDWLSGISGLSAKGSGMNDGPPAWEGLRVGSPQCGQKSASAGTMYPHALHAGPDGREFIDIFFLQRACLRGEYQNWRNAALLISTQGR